MRILIAEDEALVAGELQRELERHGHVVTVTGDGREAIEQLEVHDFDRVLVDLMMPYIDGFEVIRWIRKHPTKRTMWVALMTAMANDIDAATRDAVGADLYIPKPFDIQTVLSQLTNDEIKAI